MATSILHVGMDVHKDSITVAVFASAGREPIQLERLPSDPKRVRRFFERLTRDGARVRACYEASGAGYVLQRQLQDRGIHCDVIAPSLIPKRAGERRKTDTRDATELGRLYRSGELVVIHIPTEAEEEVRDLVRCRETFQRETLGSRHYILKFMRRRGFIFRQGTNWTRRHFEWIRRILASGDLSGRDQVVLSEYLALLEYKIDRREELDRKIEEIALRPRWAPFAERLQCFRGLRLHAAMVLATEIGDFRRFESPRKLMAYVGLVPSEHSSGTRRRQGAITKAGNAHCRHVLVQAAWSYRNRPTVGAVLKRRQRGQDPDVIAHGWKAQHRLYKLFHRIHANKPAQVAAVAVARELVGFLWAVLQDVKVEHESMAVAEAA